LAALGIRPEAARRAGAMAVAGDAAMAKIAFCLLTLLIWIDQLVARDALDEPALLAAYRPGSETRRANSAMRATTA